MALAPHAQHVGDGLLGHQQLAARQPVQAQQQPAAQRLIQRVVAHTAVCDIWVMSACV
jgi:hypothetical protein